MSAQEKKTVIVIDDDDTLRELMESMLERLGYDVLLAGSGRQAIDMSENHQGSLDIAFMDLFLPDMRGDKVSPEIRKKHPGLKVIMMSGYSLTDTNVLDTEVHGFLQKPCSFESLSQALDTLDE